MKIAPMSPSNHRTVTHLRWPCRTVFFTAIASAAVWLSAGPVSAAEPPVGTAGEARTAAAWAGVVEPDFPFFSAVLDARDRALAGAADNLTPRGLILNLGNDCWACFDTDLLRMSAIWSGRGITAVSMSQGSYYIAGQKAPEGQERLPKLQGTPWLVNGIYPGWGTGEQPSIRDPREPGPDPREVGRGPLPITAGRFRAVRLVPGGIRLEYEVAGVAVTEWVTSRMSAGQPSVQRHFRLERVPQNLWLMVGHKSTAAPGIQLRLRADPIGDAPGADQVERPDGLVTVRVHPSGKPLAFEIGLGAQAGTPDAGDSRTALGSGLPTLRWPQVVTTHATRSKARDAYVVDNIPLPLVNPWRRNVRLADIAFFKDGRAAGVTFDGDVWMISGLGDGADDVSWRRFASGLHEPLGLCVRGDDLFVFDRNGIWRLRDTDGNGEADVHELFSNAFGQTAETREFAAGIRAAPDGSFVIAKGGQQATTLGKNNGSVLRIAADGLSATVLAHGLRQPFLGVNPDTGLVTISDQEGHYVPTTPLYIAHGDEYHGYLPLILPKEKYPAPIADPLLWIPHPINASAASQVWLNHARMGPLNGALIHLGYYRPELFEVLLDRREPGLQAAIVSITRDLEFAPLAGAVNPADGQLYVAGFQIFGTTANQVSGLARLRHTGAPSTLPREVVPMDQGVLLRFDVALEDRRAADPANYSAERWNYVRTSNYGSPHFKPDGSKGQEAMIPSSAYLSRDGKGVFIGIPGMKPVMQMRLGWALAMRAGGDFGQNTYFTPRVLPRFDPVAEGFAPLTVDLTPRSARMAAVATPVTVEEGRRVSELMGCVACHSNDGSMIGKIGPTWKGLFGSKRVFANGGSAVADEAYIRESIRNPAAKVVRGFETSETGMPSYDGIVSDPQVEALVLYIKSL